MQVLERFLIRLIDDRFVYTRPLDGIGFQVMTVMDIIPTSFIGGLDVRFELVDLFLDPVLHLIGLARHLFAAYDHVVGQLLELEQQTGTFEHMVRDLYRHRIGIGKRLLV